MKTLILTGDSIRMGYQKTVEQQLKDVAEIWAPEENGGDSANVLAHLNDWIISRQPDIVHVNCGLHDLKKEFNTSTAQVPLNQYEDNVRQIMSRLKAETQSLVIWASTTPVDEKLHHENKPFDRFDADVAAYNAVASRIASETGVSINDLYKAMSDAGASGYLQKDGVHFTPEGYELLGRTVADFIRPLLT